MTRDRKLIEIGDAIGLRPEADLARLLECPVLSFEQALMVEEDRESRAFERDLQVVPPALRDLVFHSIGARRQTLGRYRRSCSVFNLIEHDIVFESICTDDVVVV